MCWSSAGFAQEQAKASISGTVTDPSHAAVAGAKISLNYAGLATLIIESDSEGKYSVEVVPGPYKISVTVPNVGEKTFENVNLTPGKKLTLNVELEPPSAASKAPAVSVQEQPQQKTGSGKASIRGTVLDPSQAVVVGAKAELTGTGGKLAAQNSDKGIYAFSDIPPGTYTLTVTAANFAPKVFDNMAVTPGLELTLDIPLEPPSEKTEVNVESTNVGKVETETATVSGTITQQEVVKIQLNGRNFSQLIALRRA